tara:strand:+ start:2036 stop:3085 length:1050 start_codon:yes stop_codon:yes gene_type:complete
MTTKDSTQTTAGLQKLNWACPACHGDLDTAADSLTCKGCGRSYPLVAELPDFRVDAPAWIDFDHDRERALHIDAIARKDGLSAAILDVFRNSRKFDEKKSQYRLRQVLAGIEKCNREMTGWLAPLTEDPVFDLGVGPGQFVAAAARRGRVMQGIDVSLEWLMVAKHWARSLGVEPVLAGALAERLPLKDGALRSVISYDVIEHVGDQNRYASEIGRVLAPGGTVALVTPNRYSLSPEPHAHVWGVGYLPVRWQAGWVKLMSGREYTYCRLLSTGEIRHLFRKEAGIELDIVFPRISDEEIAQFGDRKTKLAQIYNRVTQSSVAVPVMPFAGAYYRASGTKPGTPEGTTA